MTTPTCPAKLDIPQAMRDNLGLICKMASIVQKRRGGRIDDWKGLVTTETAYAMKYFDPSKGFKLSTYLVRAVLKRVNQIADREEGKVRVTNRETGRETPKEIFQQYPASDGEGSPWEPPSPPPARENLDAAFEAEALEQAVHRHLSERHQEVFKLIKQGVTLPDIGERLKLTKNAMKHLMNDIRRMWGVRHIKHDQCAKRAFERNMKPARLGVNEIGPAKSPLSETAST